MNRAQADARAPLEAEIEELRVQLAQLDERNKELLDLVEDRTSKMCECLCLVPYGVETCGACGFRFTQTDDDLRPVVSANAQYASFVTEEDRKR